MSNEYLEERDRKYITKSRELLRELPPYVRQFYDAKKGSKKELTRHAYLLDIKEFLTYLAEIHHRDVKTFPFEILGELSPMDIDDYKNSLHEINKPASVKRKLASISSFYKYLVLAGFVTNNPAAIIDWPAEDKSKGIIYLDDEQTARLLNGIKSNNKQMFYLTEEGDPSLSTVDGRMLKGRTRNKHTEYVVRDIDETTRRRRDRVRLRNYLITLLFLKTGIRVSELVSIDLDDIDFRNTVIVITGKGGKTRPVGFGEEGVVNALKDYIAVERRHLIGNNYGENALFVSANGKRISVRQVETMIKEMVQTYLADDEFIKKEDFSPHKLRSTCATRLLDQTGDIKGVSDLLGHESIEITSRKYAALSQMKNAKEMEKHNLL